MNDLLRALRAWPTLLRVGLAEMVAYRAELVIWILTSTTPLIMMVIWSRASQDGAVGDYDADALARYFVATLIVRQLTGCWLVWEMNQDIRTGAFSVQLLRPVNPLLIHAANTLAVIPFRVLLLVPLVGALLLWKPAAADALGQVAWLPFALSLTAAWLINFFVQAMMGCLAFWWRQSLGIFNVWHALFLISSGYVFPLSLLPPGIRGFAEASPFAYLMSAPVELLSGRLQGAAAWQAVGGGALWALLCGVGAAVVWRRGVAHHEAVGA